MTGDWRAQLRLISLTILGLIALDAIVAVGLATVAPESLRTYFEYGRSVPGKLERWVETPAARGNLFDVAWIPDVIAGSDRLFAEGAPDRPMVRGYGMSFINQLLHAAAEADPTLHLDLHSGPSAPPNYTYALFVNDAANRRSGDVAVLGVLSSSVAAMAALSNQTWNFESPAPFTYPIWRPEGTSGLSRIDPVVKSDQDARAVASGAPIAKAWAAQLAAQDLMYSPTAYDATWLDVSPFARLVRRSLATSAIRADTQAVTSGEANYPWAETLIRMSRLFAAQARAEGLIPVVVLVQGRDLGDPDLRAALAPALSGDGIPTLITADLVSPRSVGNFLPDSHYNQEANAVFGQAMADLIATQRASTRR
jgi:hypothetical protein